MKQMIPELNKLFGHKIELHRHLDGCLRPKTLMEINNKRNIIPDLPHDNVEDFIHEITIKDGFIDLPDFLQKMWKAMLIIKDDQSAIERMCFEAVEDLQRDGIQYAELRYDPHLLIENQSIEKVAELTEMINKWIFQAAQKQNIEVRLILCVIRNFQETAIQTAELTYKNNMQNGKKMIVGLDIAGDESIFLTENGLMHQAFQLAKKHDVGRTIHAGESTSAEEVIRAIELCDVHRIGHGYRIFYKKEGDDQNAMDKALKLVKEKNIHLEMCPRSSLLLKSVPIECHPLKDAVNQEISVSISSDDPGVFHTVLADDQNDAIEIGISEFEQQRWMNIQAMKSSFAEDSLKDRIVEQLIKL